jgi:hypothetical protein
MAHVTDMELHFSYYSISISLYHPPLSPFQPFSTQWVKKLNGEFAQDNPSAFIAAYYIYIYSDLLHFSPFLLLLRLPYDDCRLCLFYFADDGAPRRRLSMRQSLTEVGDLGVILVVPTRKYASEREREPSSPLAWDVYVDALPL